MPLAAPWRTGEKGRRPGLGAHGLPLACSEVRAGTQVRVGAQEDPETLPAALSPSLLVMGRWLQWQGRGCAPGLGHIAVKVIYSFNKHS